MVVELDLLDRRILAVLNQNSRLPFKAIGKLAGCSREVAAYRIKRLLSEGVLSGFYAVVSASRLGFQAYALLISFENYSPRLGRRLFQELGCHKLVRYVRKCRGVCDAVIGILCRSRRELSEFIDGLNEKYAKIIRGYQLLVPIKPLKFRSLSFLLPDPMNVQDWNFNPVSYSVTKTDLLVLSAVVNDARAELGSLSNKTGLSTETVSYSLKKLVRNGILKQYCARLDLAKLGFSEYSVFLKVNGFTRETERRLISVFEASPNILRAQRIVGNYDIELRIISSSAESLEGELDRLWTTLENKVKYASYAVMLGSSANRSCSEELLLELEPIKR